MSDTPATYVQRYDGCKLLVEPFQTPFTLAKARQFPYLLMGKVGDLDGSYVLFNVLKTEATKDGGVLWTMTVYEDYTGNTGWDQSDFIHLHVASNGTIIRAHKYIEKNWSGKWMVYAKPILESELVEIEL